MRKKKIFFVNFDYQFTLWTVIRLQYLVADYQFISQQWQVSAAREGTMPSSRSTCWSPYTQLGGLDKGHGKSS